MGYSGLIVDNMKMDDMWNFSWVVYGSTSHYKGDYVNYLVRGRDKIWSERLGCSYSLFFMGRELELRIDFPNLFPTMLDLDSALVNFPSVGRMSNFSTMFWQVKTQMEFFRG